MNLLWKILRFLALTILRLMINLFGIFIRFLLPIILAGLRLLRTLVSMSLTATIHGPRPYIDRLASEWTYQLIISGVSRDHLDQLYSLCRFLATSLIVLGWVVAALFTVAILRVVFGFFT